MHLTKTQINKYKEIYRKKFGKDISDAEVIHEGMKLMLLVQTVLGTNR